MKVPTKLLLASLDMTSGIVTSASAQSLSPTGEMTYGVSPSTVVLAFNHPVINAYVDTTLMGTIPHPDPSAPTSNTQSCKVGEYFGDTNYHYVCIATNTWKRITWDTTW